MKPGYSEGRMARNTPAVGVNGDKGAMHTVMPANYLPQPVLRPGAEDYQHIPSLVNGKRVPYHSPTMLVSDIPRNIHNTHTND